jgi:hypothetical protein
MIRLIVSIRNRNMCERHTKLNINGLASPKIIFIDISTARRKNDFSV